MSTFELDQKLIGEVVSGMGKHETFPYAEREVFNLLCEKSGGVFDLKQFKELWETGSFEHDSACVYGIYKSPIRQQSKLIPASDTGENIHMNSFIDYLRDTQIQKEVFDYSAGMSYVYDRFREISEEFEKLDSTSSENPTQYKSMFVDLSAAMGKIRKDCGYAELIYPSVALSQIDPTHFTIFCIPPNVIGFRADCTDVTQDAITSSEFQILLEELAKSNTRLENIIFVTGLPLK